MKKVCETFRRKNNIEMLTGTFSEHGVFSLSKTDAALTAHIRNISDVSGAGDTVISVASCCLAAGASQYDVAAIATLPVDWFAKKWEWFRSIKQFSK